MTATTVLFTADLSSVLQQRVYFRSYTRSSAALAAPLILSKEEWKSLGSPKKIEVAVRSAE